MNNHDEDEPLSRQAYREAQRRANARRHEDDSRVGNDGLLHRHQEQAAEEDPVNNEVEDREFEYQQAHALTAEEKTARLKHRLNVAIAVLIVLIVLVYLILFFVD